MCTSCILFNISQTISTCSHLQSHVECIKAHHANYMHLVVSSDKMAAYVAISVNRRPSRSYGEQQCYSLVDGQIQL
jgi:hypothetical protein